MTLPSLALPTKIYGGRTAYIYNQNNASIMDYVLSSNTWGVVTPRDVVSFVDNNTRLFGKSGSLAGNIVYEHMRRF